MRILNTKQLSLFILLVLLLSITSGALAQTSANLVVDSVEAQPKTGQYAFDVAVNFLATQAGGTPIRNLQLSDMTITEDGKPVNITSLVLAEDDPINVVVVMDTSGSMQGVKMDAARSAASQFIAGLGKNDLVAVTSFNSIVKTAIGFTDNLADAREKIDLLSAWDGAGTCLYDALYEAITLTATLPSGRRAITLLTDGIDELPNGKKCSKHVEADVINLATISTVRVPIFIVGLGGKVDSPGLQRIADATGGRYQFAPDEQKLQGLFGNLLQQLRSQYRANYVSTAAPGPHQLVLEAKISGQQIRKLHEFVLPNFPYKILIVLPKEAEPINGRTKFSIQIIGQGDPIAKVEFFVNDTSIGAVESLPYELDWEPAADATGVAKIDVVALDAKGGELARSTFETVYAAHEAIPTPVSSATAVGLPTAVASPTAPSGLSMPVRILIGGLVFLILVVVVIVVVFAQRRKQKERERLWQEKVQGVGVNDSSSGQDRTLDSFSPSAEALGALVVLQSDDPAMQGQFFEITKQTTNLGRKADNDIIFPKDSPVSRHHCVIEARNGGLFLSEILTLEKGASNRPAYGTFVNDKQVGDPTLLKNGDQIRLGKRLRLRFDGVERSPDNGNTFDQYTGSDAAKTMDDMGS